MVFSLQACKKDPIVKTINYDYLIFGTVYGECIGPNCITLYKLEDGKLYKNSSREYPNLNSNYAGDYALLSSDKYGQTKDLPDHFPEEFLMKSVQFVGCPDCVDQGGYYVEFSKNGKMKNWMIDRSKANLPKELHAFIDKLGEKMELLK